MKPSKTKASAMPPALVILHADFVIAKNGVLMTWKAGLPITDRASIDMILEYDAPADHYQKVNHV